MKLINADALHDDLRAKKKWIVKRKGKFNVGYTYDQVHFAIDDQTTIEAIPIEWIGDWLYDHSALQRTETEINIMLMIIDWQKEQEKEK